MIKKSGSVTLGRLLTVNTHIFLFGLSVLFTEILWSGGSFVFLTMTMLKYSKTYPSLLPLLHPSVHLISSPVISY